MCNLICNAEIADLAQVQRSAVSNWIKRYDDFPVPVYSYLSNVRIWDRDEMLTWLLVNGKLSR